MDAALILLLRLRFRGALRKLWRKVSTAKGLLMTVAGLAFFAIMIVPSLLTTSSMPPEFAERQIAGFLRFGPFFFLAYCLLILILSPGDKAFAFTPAEVSFLFPGPFGRRSLLAYKIGGNLALTTLGGGFMLFAFRGYCRTWFAGYVGLVLAFGFLQLFQIGVTVAGQAIGAAASTWRRALGLGLVVAIALAAALTLGVRSLANLDLASIMALEHAPFVRALRAPFVPFVRAIAAPRVWPDLLMWAAAGLAIDAALFAAILGLDAQYLEAAAAGSERFYARLERMRQGGTLVTWSRKGKVWKSVLPTLPWWGGIGPIAWRQLTTAGRDWLRALVPVLASLGIAGMGVFLANSSGENGDRGEVAPAMGGVIVGLSLALTLLLTFDFRGDFDRMEGLKSLPIRPSRLVLGQLAAPWMLLTGSQVAGLVFLAIGAGPVPPWYWAYAAFAPLVNLLLLEIDNLIFLHFPSRPMVHTPGDIAALGRMTFMMLAKVLVGGLAIGLATLVGFAAWWFAGSIAAVAAAWVVMAATTALFVALLVMAFDGFDVASETPA